MQLQQNRTILIDRMCYSVIMLLSFARVVTSKVKACPQYFDCESYLAMLHNIAYDPSIPGHHAMRVLPTLLAKGFHAFGFSPTLSFQIVSGMTYCLLGIMVYWFLRKQKQSPGISFAFALLCLAPHHAMRIPLQLVYQSCDMLTYPITLGLIYYGFQKQLTGIFVVGLLGILTRQNLFILTELSLLFCFVQNRTILSVCYSVTLAIVYFSLQIYYHASGVFGALLNPPDGYFTVSHLTYVLTDSRLVELVVPIIPLLLFSSRAVINFLVRNWHLALYMAIVVGQPLLGYHLTGNNAQRLALQGVWLLYIVCALTFHSQSQKVIALLIVYSLGMYFMWGMEQRLILCGLLGSGMIYIKWWMNRAQTVHPAQ